MAQIAALGVTAQGIGRSKKDAKHDAARHMINRMRTSHPGLDDIPQAEVVSIAAPSVDAVRLLRDLCVQGDNPLPQFELIQQAGSSDSPQYTYQCSIGQIVRMATAMNKKMAKQLAAQQLIDIMQIVSTVCYIFLYSRNLVLGICRLLFSSLGKDSSILAW